MASVWYIGRANTREAFGFTWNRYNGWSIPEAEFSPSQLDALRADSGFKLNQPDGPRGLPAPSGGPVIDNMFYTYYVELMGILENLEGYGLQLTGYVGSYSELPAEAPDGAMYLTADTGVIYIRQGGAWPAEPDGVPIRGPQGLKGDKGDQGDVGPQGEQGPQGIQGVKGDKGDKGDQGDQGPQGEQGPQGIQGIQGIQGEVGPEGPPAATTIASKPGTDLPSTYPTGISVMEVGDDATWPVSFATVETVRFGTNRSYQTIVERSTARSWRRTPQGGDVGWNAWVEWGAQGPQGEQGPVGAGAPDATDTTKGSIQLAGDLSGTAAAPTVPGLAGKANSTHTHAQSEITDLVADLSDKVDNTDPRLSDARTPTAHTHAQSEITDLVADLADKVDNTDPRLSDARTPTAHTHAQSDVNGLDTALAAKADLVGGKVPQAQIPSAALTDYLGEVASQAAMLALTGQRGDWATRTDLGTDWQLIADDPTLIGSWREHTYPSSPVQSVAGRTGAVTLTTTDLTDVTTVGANVAKAADQAAARTAIGAGTSSLAIGTTAGTAAEGNDPRLADTRTPTDGTVTNSKVAANAAIALSKLATGYVQGSSNGTPATLTVWVGTEAQYTAIVTKDPNTLYFRTA